MTTLIITVISILLAAVCALMIVFFGGEWGDASANNNIGDGPMGCQMKGSTGTFYALT
jgi:hypothetical protein